MGGGGGGGAGKFPAALECVKKTYKLVSTLAPSFLFGSSSFLQVRRETI